MRTNSRKAMTNNRSLPRLVIVEVPPYRSKKREGLLTLRPSRWRSKVRRSRGGCERFCPGPIPMRQPTSSLAHYYASVGAIKGWEFRHRPTGQETWRRTASVAMRRPRTYSISCDGGVVNRQQHAADDRFYFSAESWHHDKGQSKGEYQTGEPVTFSHTSYPFLS